MGLLKGQIAVVPFGEERLIRDALWSSSRVGEGGGVRSSVNAPSRKETIAQDSLIARVPNRGPNEHLRPAEPTRATLGTVRAETGVSARNAEIRPVRIMFLYLGRRGIISRLMLEIMRSVHGCPNIETSGCLSRQNEIFRAFAEFGKSVASVNTFATDRGAIFSAWRIPKLRQRIGAELRRRHVSAVIELMPHVWSPFLVSAIRSAGARYITVAHDAVAHPGDLTGRANRVIDLAVSRADRVITLSQTVTARLRDSGRVLPERISTLFLPNIIYSSQSTRTPWKPEAPLRVLFLGRILPYKGLGLFVDALERLTQAGLRVEAGVFGEGALGANEARLKRIGAEVVNRWIGEEEIAPILSRYDIMVVSHVEASQSGVVATAFGAGLPVIATPVGALPEQVSSGINGLVADAVSGDALAMAIRRVADDSALYATLCKGVENTREQRSVQRFVDECVKLVP